MNTATKTSKVTQPTHHRRYPLGLPQRVIGWVAIALSKFSINGSHKTEQYWYAYVSRSLFEKGKFEGGRPLIGRKVETEEIEIAQKASEILDALASDNSGNNQNRKIAAAWPKIFDHIENTMKGEDPNDWLNGIYHLMSEVRNFPNFERAFWYYQNVSEKDLKDYYRQFIKEKAFDGNAVGELNLPLTRIKVKRSLNCVERFLENHERLQCVWLRMHNYYNNLKPRMCYHAFNYAFSSIIFSILENNPELLPDASKLMVTIIISHVLTSFCQAIDFQKGYVNRQYSWDCMAIRNIEKLKEKGEKLGKITANGCLNAASLGVGAFMTKVFPKDLLRNATFRESTKGTLKSVLRTIVTGKLPVSYDATKLAKYVMKGAVQGLMAYAIKECAKGWMSTEQDRNFTAFVLKDIFDPFLQYTFIQMMVMTFLLYYGFIRN